MRPGARAVATISRSVALLARAGRGENVAVVLGDGLIDRQRF